MARWLPVPLDSQGREVGWDQETVYTAHHQAGQQDTTVLEGGVAGVLAESPGGAVDVRATITTGCLATLNLTLVDSEPGQRDMQADEIWEQMVRQAWRDIVLTVNRDRALYGVGLAPLELDPLLPQQLTVNTDLAGYAVTLALWNITVTTPLLLLQFIPNLCRLRVRTGLSWPGWSWRGGRPWPACRRKLTSPWSGSPSGAPTGLLHCSVFPPETLSPATRRTAPPGSAWEVSPRRAPIPSPYP